MLDRGTADKWDKQPPALKPWNLYEPFRGFENPLPGLKVRGWHNG
jgi:hypothetical protein